MSLDRKVADLLHREFETIRTLRDPAQRYALAEIKEVSTGSALISKTDTRCAGEYLERATEYLDRALRRLTELGEPWTDSLRADVDAMLRRELEQDWSWLVGLREQQVGHRVGSERLLATQMTAHGRIEVELGFRVLREEKRRLPIAELLTAPRYDDVRQHWELANEYAQRSHPADNEAAREAILALEALARLAADDPNATLGKAIGVLNARTDAAGRLLLSSFEKVWAFSNQARSLRHGGGAGDPVTSPEAQYVVGVAGNAIRLLLTFDLG